MLGTVQRQSVILFVDAIAALCAPSHDRSNMESLKEKVDVALARLERDFPLSLQVQSSNLTNIMIIIIINNDSK